MIEEGSHEFHVCLDERECPKCSKDLLFDHESEDLPIHSYKCTSCDFEHIVKIPPKDIKPCPCCGQDRPFPTEPGKWQYKLMPLSIYGKNEWTTVDVIPGPEEEGDGILGIIPEGEEEPIWWPERAIWRKVE